ncbi:DUF4062 domain-containing protein [Flintibacter porci]|uniref:DUF4062 domain-containing protein n=1 Tax=Flintibacter porci TaxID=3342383 RepID=UPI003F893B3B
MALHWVIGVLSTDYDLHEYRDALITQLEDSGVCVSAFELPEFPVEPDQHSHESCITALKRTNVVILIVDQRYGGIYYDTSKVSITMQEYLTAIEKGIPCLVFVNRKTWEERHTYKHDLKASGQDPQQFDASYSCKYVESVDVLHFVDEICSAYNNHKCSNWISVFDGIPDLLENVEGKLKGLSRFWVKNLVNAQREKLLDRKTSTCFSMSLGDVFRNGYYMEPEYEQESGELPSSECDLADSIVSGLLDMKSILIYGEAGYGKTTILAKSFLRHAEKFNVADDYNIPFYIWLKGKSANYHFDFYNYIQESFVDNLNLEPYPFLDLSNIRPYFYLDGFDELAEDISTTIVNQISNSSIFSFPLILTSRVQYALRYLANFDFVNHFSVRIRINKWDIKKAKKYIDNFCQKKGKDNALSDRIYGLLADNSELCDLLDSPLLITMLLWVIEANRMTIPETISTRVQLFQAFLCEMAKREIHRTDSELEEENLVLIWSYFAWLVYKEKLFGRQANINDIFRKLQNEILPEYQVSYCANLFDVLFDLEKSKVYGTFHEQFLEFLVANAFYHASCKKRSPYPEFLRYVVRPEINRYFRALCQEDLEEARELVATNIFNQYLENVGSDDDKAVATRVHAIYHVSRIPCTQQEERLQRAFKIENHVSVRLSLFFGAIKKGQLDKEDEFYHLLLSDSQYNAANRGYHLAYYDKPNYGSMPFEDDGGNWPNTLNAFLRHFNSEKKEQYYLRRIDLLTLYQFMESRRAIKPMTKDILLKLEYMVLHPRFNQPDFQPKIEAMFHKVKEKFEELSSDCNC